MNREQVTSAISGARPCSQSRHAGVGNGRRREAGASYPVIFRRRGFVGKMERF